MHSNKPSDPLLGPGGAWRRRGQASANSLELARPTLDFEIEQTCTFDDARSRHLAAQRLRTSSAVLRSGAVEDGLCSFEQSEGDCDQR